MKNLFLCLFVALSSFAFGQQTYLNKIPPFPSNINQEAVSSFIEKLNVLNEEINVLVKKYEAENSAAASNIDPAAVAAAYSKGNVDVMGMQKKNQEMLANQNKLTAKLQKYQQQSDSINTAFNNELSPYLEKYNQYSEKCRGEGGNATTCNQLKSELASMGNKILVKYWYELKTSEYQKYLLSILNELKSLHVLCSVQSLESAEYSSGIKFPHKEDLGYLKFALNYIGFIKSAWSIDSRLWQ